jgi:hypothetical protein
MRAGDRLVFDQRHDRVTQHYWARSTGTASRRSSKTCRSGLDADIGGELRPGRARQQVTEVVAAKFFSSA